MNYPIYRAVPQQRHRRGRVWLVLFGIGIPLIELYLLAQLEDRWGLGNTLLLVLATAVVGVWAVRRQGTTVYHSARQALAAGQAPIVEVAHGVLLLFGGVLLIIPGVITDSIGLLLMVPLIRELIRRRFPVTFRMITW